MNTANIVARLQAKYGNNELKTKAEIYSHAEMRRFVRSDREGAGVDLLPYEVEAVRAALAAL